jgi:hypothetical protein
MQRFVEDVPCALCHMPAQRHALQQPTDGYIFDCPACGGRYSVNIGFEVTHLPLNGIGLEMTHPGSRT